MDVDIKLLGGFEVTVDGVRTPDDAWTRRHAVGLVKLLALSEGRRAHREQVVDALWRDTPVESALPRLHKAAHFARRGLGGAADSVVLLNESVRLLPQAAVRVDTQAFRSLAESAIAGGSTALAEQALALYAGPLLPEDLYEPWAAEPREALRLLHLDLLRMTGRWQEVLTLDPVDEAAHVALARAAAERGDPRAGLRQLERMDQALRRELGTAPSAEAESLRRSLQQAVVSPALGAVAAGGASRGVRLVGRRGTGDAIRALLDRAEQGRGGTLLVSGPAGVGKSAVLDLARASAQRRGWRIGSGTASAVEGTWPYACVLEALGDLCRQHPALLDGLEDHFRNEIERAMSGREVTWSGESAHQRLFVATAELLRLASAGRGLLLLIDDVHQADEASLRLLHYLARCADESRVLLVVSHRSGEDSAVRPVAASLAARGTGSAMELAPLDEAATRRLVALEAPDVDDATADHIWAVSGGLPFSVLELARAVAAGREPGIGVHLGLAPEVEHTLARVALLGSVFTTDELLAVSGVAEEDAYRHLDAAVAALLVEPAEPGFRFRHALLRQTLLDRMPAAGKAAARIEVADALARLGAAPARVAHLYVAAGLPRRAVPFVVPAVETAGALGAYRDALTLVDGVRDHATGAERAHLLARRGDLLMALGNPEAVPAYREAAAITEGTEHRLVRARLARAACFAGEFDTAAAALAGVGLEEDAADGPLLLARGNLAYFTGDVDAAWEAATAARRLLLTPDDPWHYVDLVALQGLIAHQRGEWFERFRMELRRTSGTPGLATALFDAHLCVAEYLLYGPVPYPEVIEMADGLRRRAIRAGALRGVAFATALIGEAALLMGDLDRAERELTEAVDLHRDVDASAGEAHSLQRLAEVLLAQGEPDEARRLLQRALPLARWSVISMHLLQRIYGTMIACAPDPTAARAVVDRAEATLGETDACPFCDIMLAVPSAIACASVGDVTAAERHLAVATASAARWEGSAWEAAVLEARAHVARARGEADEFDRLIGEAVVLFRASGQPRDVDRCERSRRVATEVAGLGVT